MTPQTPIAYVVTPISEKPEKEGTYLCIRTNGTVKGVYRHGGENFPFPSVYTHWLRPVYELEIVTLRSQVAAYKALVKAGDAIRAHQYKLLSEAKTVESEREANALLTDELEVSAATIKSLRATIIDQDAQILELRKELERVKAVVYYTNKSWHCAFYRATSEMTAREIHDFWLENLNEFKTKHNL